MFPLTLVLIVAGDLLSAETIPEFEKLDSVLSRLFEHNEAIDVPGVKADAILTIEHQLGQKLKHDEHNLIILVEGIEGTFDDSRVVVWVEPVEEHIEGLRVVAAAHDTSEDVK